MKTVTTIVLAALMSIAGGINSQAKSDRTHATNFSNQYMQVLILHQQAPRQPMGPPDNATEALREQHKWLTNDRVLAHFSHPAISEAFRSISGCVKACLPASPRIRAAFASASAILWMRYASTLTCALPSHSIARGL